jgi:SAM-dependent methyltransferase
MSQLFDSYERSYGDVVQSSIDFSGLPHSFFMAAKAAMLADVVGERFGSAPQPVGLDVGCGIGEFHRYARGLFSRLCGVDVSEKSVERAQRDNPGTVYTSYDGNVLPYDSGAFDVTMTTCVMHHVPPAQWLSFLHEMRRVTRPGGILCVIEHNPFNPLTRLAVSRCEFDRDAVLLRAGRTERLMAVAGLSDVESRFFLMLPSAAPLARRIERLFRRVPFGAQYLTCARA